MKRLCCRFIFVSVFCGSAAFGQPDAKTLIRESIQNYERDWRTGMHWGYTQTDVTRSDGSNEVEVSEVIPLDGTPYERLISKDGHSLSPEDQRKEEQKYEKALHERQNESPQARQARIRKYAEQRAFIKEVPEAYNFTLLGEDSVDGRKAWMVELKPRPDFVPVSSHASMLKHIEGKLWIDQQDVQWAKAEAYVIDTISIGWILARIGPGAHITMDMTRVSDGFWMPKAIDIEGTAKVLMVHTKSLNEKVTFAGYHPENGNLATRPTKVRGSKSFQ